MLAIGYEALYKSYVLCFECLTDGPVLNLSTCSFGLFGKFNGKTVSPVVSKTLASEHDLGSQFETRQSFSEN